jgi:predicted enzyme related to lactoylglutathione lyase
MEEQTRAPGLLGTDATGIPVLDPGDPHYCHQESGRSRSNAEVTGMARVTGIGGVFLRSADPKALGAWYAKHLGVVVGDYGATFWWKDEVPKGTGMTAWNPFPMDTSYFGEGKQAVMINYRVDDLDALLGDLAAAGVWIDPKRQNESYGRFAWIKDCDGNRVELWQPLDQGA